MELNLKQKLKQSRLLRIATSLKASYWKPTLVTAEKNESTLNALLYETSKSNMVYLADFEIKRSEALAEAKRQCFR